MDWLREHMWESWLALAVLLGVLELVSLDLFLAMLAGGGVPRSVLHALPSQNQR